MNRIKIALWKPTHQLIRNSEKLDSKLYCISKIFTDEIQQNEDNSKWKVFTEKDLDTFDVMLIEFENHQITRKKLSEKYAIGNRVFTFEEYWVLDCEDTITRRYHEYWNQLHHAQIHPFEAKTVLIFGGSSGIGKETALAFLKAGANVIIAGRNEERLKLAESELEKEENNLAGIQWDITEIGNYESKLAEAESLFHREIDVVINSAGIWTNSTFYEVTEKEYDEIMGTNLKGIYFICQLFANYFIGHQIKGHIVNVLSNTGALPTVKPYGISKWGGYGLTKGLGMHLAEYGIIVNGVAPGGIATELANWHKGDCQARRNSRIGRIGFPCEVAQIILQLAGFMGDNMPGEIVVCDGGDKAIGISL